MTKLLIPRKKDDIIDNNIRKNIQVITKKHTPFINSNLTEWNKYCWLIHFYGIYRDKLYQLSKKNYLKANKLQNFEKKQQILKKIEFFQ